MVLNLDTDSSLRSALPHSEFEVYQRDKVHKYQDIWQYRWTSVFFE